MTAGIEANDTLAYAEENGAPWHGLGTPVDGAKDGNEMLELAGLNWVAETRPMYVYAQGGQIKVPGSFCVVRKDTGTILGPVKHRYQPVQNATTFSFGKELFARGELLYETAGSMMGNRRVWALARIPEREIVIGNGDVIYPYLLFSNSFDGSTKFIVLPTFVRVVCKNTHDAAVFTTDEEIRQLTVSFRHTGNIMDKVAEARDILQLSLGLVDRMAIVSEELVATDGLPLVEPFIAALFNTDNDDLGKRALTNRDDKVEAFRDILAEETSRRGETTAMDLFNATTGFVDHVQTVGTRGGSGETGIRTPADARMESALWLGGRDMKENSLQVLGSMTDIFARLEARKVPVRVNRAA